MWKTSLNWQLSELVFPALQLMSLWPPHIFLTTAISQAGSSEVITWPQQNHCVKGILVTLLSAQLDGFTLLSFADLESEFQQPEMVFLGSCWHVFASGSCFFLRWLSKCAHFWKSSAAQKNICMQPFLWHRISGLTYSIKTEIKESAEGQNPHSHPMYP